jgi:hypothetical protein
VFKTKKEELINNSYFESLLYKGNLRRRKNKNEASGSSYASHGASSYSYFEFRMFMDLLQQLFIKIQKKKCSKLRYFIYLFILHCSIAEFHVYGF